MYIFYVTTINDKRGCEFGREQGGYIGLEGVKERENVIIVIEEIIETRKM